MGNAGGSFPWRLALRPEHEFPHRHHTRSRLRPARRAPKASGARSAPRAPPRARCPRRWLARRRLSPGRNSPNGRAASTAHPGRTRLGTPSSTTRPGAHPLGAPPPRHRLTSSAGGARPGRRSSWLRPEQHSCPQANLPTATPAPGANKPATEQRLAKAPAAPSPTGARRRRALWLRPARRWRPHHRPL